MYIYSVHMVEMKSIPLNIGNDFFSIILRIVPVLLFT